MIRCWTNLDIWIPLFSLIALYADRSLVCVGRNTNENDFVHIFLLLYHNIIQLPFPKKKSTEIATVLINFQDGESTLRILLFKLYHKSFFFREESSFCLVQRSAIYSNQRPVYLAPSYCLTKNSETSKIARK